jgi:hypothetical protein
MARVLPANCVEVIFIHGLQLLAHFL